MTYGATVQRALVAAQRSRRGDGIDVEVIDLRTLSPWDRETVFASVKKTSRVIVAYEDSLSWGYGAEIAAAIADECFAWLDAPVTARGVDRYVRGICAAARGCDSAAGRRFRARVRGRGWPASRPAVTGFVTATTQPRALGQRSLDRAGARVCRRAPLGARGQPRPSARVSHVLRRRVDAQYRQHRRDNVDLRGISASRPPTSRAC